MAYFCGLNVIIIFIHFHTVLLLVKGYTSEAALPTMNANTNVLSGIPSNGAEQQFELHSIWGHKNNILTFSFMFFVWLVNVCSSLCFSYIHSFCICHFCFDQNIQVTEILFSSKRKRIIILKGCSMSISWVCLLCDICVDYSSLTLQTTVPQRTVK